MRQAVFQIWNGVWPVLGPVAVGVLLFVVLWMLRELWRGTVGAALEVERGCDAEHIDELCGHDWRPPECEEAVIEKIRQRREAGRRKYGTTMERGDLTRREWIQHAQEEAMDLAIYLERLLREETTNPKPQG